MYLSFDFLSGEGKHNALQTDKMFPLAQPFAESIGYLLGNILPLLL